MVKAKKIEDPKIKIVVQCHWCARISHPFVAYEKDIVDDKLTGGEHYSCCACGRYYGGSKVFKNPESPEVRIILLERQVKDLQDEKAKLKTTIEAYEKAMTMMGGGMRVGKTLFGMPY